MPAKFLTIAQEGYDFIVHDADKLVNDERWGVERVAAFMSVHHVLNVMATKYVKGMTFKPTVAAIQYTLHCDAVTSEDINKITAFLVPKLCAIYSDTTKQGFLGRPLNMVLDEVTNMVLDHIKSEEAPLEVFGQIVKPKPFLSRPSKAEYDAEIERSKAIEQELWDKFRAVLNSGKAAGHRIQIREGSNIYIGIITKVSPKCVYCDVRDEYNRLLQHGARFPRDSKRFIIESFR